MNHGYPPGFDPNNPHAVPGAPAPQAAPQGAPPGYPPGYGAPPVGYVPPGNYAPPPGGYGPPQGQQAYPAAPPAGYGAPQASAFDMGDDVRFQGKSRKFKGGFAGLCEVVDSEIVDIKNKKGNTERRFFVKFRVLDIKTQSPTDPLAPGDERTWSALVTRSGDKQKSAVLFCCLEGQNASDPAAFRAMTANVAYQNAAAARGSKALAGKRVVVTTEDTTTEAGYPFVVHNFYIAPR